MKFIFTVDELKLIIACLENRKHDIVGEHEELEIEKLLTYLNAKLKEMNQEKR